MHPRYEEWLEHVFAHPVAETAWHFDLDAPEFIADKPALATLLTETFTHAARDLTRVHRGRTTGSSRARTTYDTISLE